ncbi:MAG: DUF3761 domain-containing protein [Acidobacteriota bacterium]
MTAEPEKWLPKRCPVCKKANDTEVRICTCGYWFDQSELLRQASDLPDLKKQARKKKAAKTLVLTGFVAVILSAVAIWTGAVDFGKVLEVDKDLGSDRTSDRPSGQRAALIDKKAASPMMEGTVTAVNSGDTITLRDLANEEHSIRLSGISAPEGDEAQLAKADLESLIMGKTVKIVLQKFDLTDLAGKVLVDGKNINSELLRAGLAWHNQFSVLQTDEDRQLYADAEAYAKAGKIGVWSNPNAVPPWESRPPGDAASTDKRGADEPVSPPSKIRSERTSETGVIKTEETTERPPSVAPANSPTEQNVVASRSEVAVPPKPEVEKPRPAGPKPVVSQAGPGATARCNDGSYSYRVSRPGSCSGNGGVAEWLQAEKAPVRTDPTTTKKYMLGPRGGCFYLNSSGSKTYVDKGLCAQ